jgi:hypothetical protein
MPGLIGFSEIALTNVERTVPPAEAGRYYQKW